MKEGSWSEPEEERTEERKLRSSLGVSGVYCEAKDGRGQREARRWLRRRSAHELLPANGTAAGVEQELNVGDSAVSPHRAQRFAACRNGLGSVS